MPSPTPDPARRSDRARSSILSATRERLAEVGYAKLTIEGIASRAGVGKQTIYRWWPSKGAVVFDAILDASLGPDGSTTLPDTGELEADLRTVMRGIVGELADPATDRMQRAVLAELQLDPPLATELLERLLRPQTDAFADRLCRARDAGQVRDDLDPSVAVELFLGPVFHRWLLRTAPLDEAFADRVVEHALAGLAPR
ncbi:MAG: TetR/AcrR family transcriptional regulator [Solirubrobacteraceae bacterium]|nr:TetR/AcrR family transcriptional regulator [Solirubrobacteraceae bacterium]